MILFFSDDIIFKFRNKNLYKRWIKDVVESIQKNDPKKKIGDINIIFCSKKRILYLNNQYLKHSYYTDIITFDYSDPLKINGDLYINPETVNANSNRYKTNYHEELSRVIIHGILHLLGFNDKTTQEVNNMRYLEDYSLSILEKLKTEYQIK
jgi:rRNA maturation RNase YbeY